MRRADLAAPAGSTKKQGSTPLRPGLATGCGPAACGWAERCLSDGCADADTCIPFKVCASASAGVNAAWFLLAFAPLELGGEWRGEKDASRDKESCPRFADFGFKLPFSRFTTGCVYGWSISSRISRTTAVRGTLRMAPTAPHTVVQKARASRTMMGCRSKDDARSFGSMRLLANWWMMKGKMKVIARSPQVLVGSRKTRGSGAKTAIV
mmetsp:Transcript_26222/g.49462  ORF Transcript_26222/g.49462 Transcript_26222/m.49462 type:complete len:209 (-) Transcript_26222:714-1340(-)